MVKGGQEAEGTGGITGTWDFSHAENRFQGTIALRQSGSKVMGTWHTSKGKVEPDSSVHGRIEGNAVKLTRFIDGNQQTYVLTLSTDGNQLDGFGDGWFIHHANLNMRRASRTRTKLRTSVLVLGHGPFIREGAVAWPYS
jgi:hypothetical protein